MRPSHYAVAAVCLTVVACARTGPGQPPPLAGAAAYTDPDQPLETRVLDLLSRLTLEEKVGQMLYEADPVPRLGIPEYNWWNEALHGVARTGRATVFPQAIGLAATWDTSLMLRVATAISDEARAKHHESVRRGYRGIYEGLTFWSPNINIFRDPRWGRGMETFGEDPYLTGRLGVAFVTGMQGDDPRYLKTVATPKHYAVHSGPEPDRHRFDAVVDERDLRETYLPAFRATVTESDAQSVMCAYNRFRGDPCCASTTLLQRILRDEWGFGGYVVSDCWAIIDIYTSHGTTDDPAAAAAMSVAAGTDLNCGVTYDSLVTAVQRGLIAESQIDTAVARLLRARFRLGMFDPPERVPWASIPYEVNDSDAHRALALEAARKSVVLLKNDAVLPLAKDIGTIAVVGPNADDVDVLLGNYNGIPSDPVTPLEGIRRAVSPSSTVLYARGSDIAEGMPSLEVIPTSALGRTSGGARGLRAEYFANRTFTGAPSLTRTDAAVDFNWWDGAPADGLPRDSFAVRWTGTLTPSVSGRYALGIKAFGTARLFIDDSLLMEASGRHAEWTRWEHVDLQVGVPRRVRLEYVDMRADASVQLVWAPPDPARSDAALAAASAADVTVMFMGLSPRLEGEEMSVEVPGFSGGDRIDIALPALQQALLEDVVALGKPVVLVLLNGSALAVEWAAEHVPAIVEAWYPGQAAGTAIAEVLFGDYNPAGRLPVTFYRSAEQLPPFDEYAMAGRTYRYFDGDPLFPFGHGLSYTTFAYGHLELPTTVQAGDDVVVTAVVGNAGSRAGEEVVQLYVTDDAASAPTPVRSLAGVRRVFLEPGEVRRVEFRITPRQLSIIDDTGRRIVEPGTFTVSVGGKQPGFSGVADAVTTDAVMGRFTVSGIPVELPM